MKKMTHKEIEITMNMWGMTQSHIKKIMKKIKNGVQHTFCNKQTYNPETKILTSGQIKKLDI
jgi:hypothetical protein